MANIQTCPAYSHLLNLLYATTTENLVFHHHHEHLQPTPTGHTASSRYYRPPQIQYAKQTSTIPTPFPTHTHCHHGGPLDPPRAHDPVYPLQHLRLRPEEHGVVAHLHLDSWDGSPLDHRVRGLEVPWHRQQIGDVERSDREAEERLLARGARRLPADESQR